MIKGVSEKEFDIIKNILKNYQGKFFAYGSRVKGNFSDLSDLDVLVISENYSEVITDLKEQFDNSLLPYVVNFTDFNTLDENFYNLIKNDLVEIKS